MLPIRLRGARTHNLHGIDLELLPGQLVAVTGPSGAGKSSLALDTLYAEGQRRFVESFSPYARQFLERLERPPMEELAPVAATVAVDRRAPIKSSRSTLATMADLEPYLAAVFAREAIPTCPTCNLEAVDTSPRDAATQLAASMEGSRALVSYPVRVEDGEQFLDLRETLARDGYRRLIVGGALRDVDEVRPSEATAPGVRVEVVVDRVSVGKRDRRRLEEAIEAAWARGAGRAELRTEESTADKRHVTLARGLACPKCARRFEPPRPGLFSYNSPFGACDACRGFGRIIAVDWDKVIPDPRKSLRQGAIRPWSGPSTEWERGILEKFCKARKIPLEVPWEKMRSDQRALVIDGEGQWRNGKYPGVRAWFEWLETRTYKMHVRVLLSRYRVYSLCGACGGSRLNATALAYRVAGYNLAQWHSQTVSEALARTLGFAARDAQGKRVREQLVARLGYLDTVGLGYLTLDRQARTLSGGEAQRAGLTTALGAALTGTLFVLDEPTVGLHAADVPSLTGVMRELARAGNTVLVVEHEPGVVRSCDRVLEMGPGAGPHGGRLLFDGSPSDLARRLDLPTGREWANAHAGAREVRKARGWLVVRGAREHNLRGVDARIPIGVVCGVTGPSGSGKSTLVHDVLYRAVARAAGDMSVDKPGKHDGLEGAKSFERAVLVDQSPLGRTARGNSATYVKAWDRIRARFAAEAEAGRRQLTAAHFSFNVPAGRCEECAGEGFETVEMQFLADVQLLCPVCQGKRFKPEVLAVKHKGRSIADVLAMSVEEVLAEFDPPADRDYVLRRALDPITKVGLGYLSIGQPLSTLSGGEAQRLKLARALSETAKATLFVVDEPSAGLHAQDAAHVVGALHSLVEQGASVVVVEHDLDVIRACDWVIDLGPGGGPEGGRIVATGTPGQVAESDTRTGAALRATSTPTRIPTSSSATSSTPNSITVSHAREHNLKEVTCSIPHGKVCVVTGPSGSGKSSLAFDVIFAEGQRRFMETLTPYARQFLPTLPRPDVDAVSGVPPAIALEQRTSRGGANSTVATVTEIAHYLRLLYAKVGELHCPDCDAAVIPMNADLLFDRLSRSDGTSPASPGRGRNLADSRNKTLYAPAVRGRKGTYLDLFTSASRAGIQAARVDGAIVSIDPPPKLAKTKEHTIDLIVFYGKLRGLDRAVFDRALSWGAGVLRVGDGPPSARPNGGEQVLSTARVCPKCGKGVPELDPRWFSFNTRQGQCEACEGTGVEGGPAAFEDADGPRIPCETCGGSRLSAVPRRVRLDGETYAQTTERSVSSALKRARDWRFTGPQAEIARAPFAEFLRRLAFVEQVGLGYLALDRPAATLSGGEMQRLRLSAQLGSGLTGALYVLDEPTIGLHPRDTRRLLHNLRQLADMGSTVIVVEHDAETIRAADHVVDLGPGGGRLGGHVVAEGPAAEVLADPRSPTGRALKDSGRIARPKRPMADAWIELSGARANNLRDVTLRVPVGRMCVVAGVSGSGKSTLVRQVFYPALRRALKLVAPEPGAHAGIKGISSVRRALAVDQSPIGRTPRSVPATFLGVWDDVRKLFAALPEAKVRGYTAARFSFNGNAGGRCVACQGQGTIVAEMPFLPDVVAPCDACGGSRFEPSTLEVRYAGLSIGDVLHLPAADAAQLFAHHPKISRPLATLSNLGIGYVQLGQGSNTLSGGEAQRLKLAAELTAGAAHEATVYVLDEPTTGLHLTDVRRLLGVMEELVARGDTLVVVEHHPDVIACADWVVELGPEAGEAGGRVVFEGEPRRLPRAKTATGRYLAGQAGATESSPAP